MPDKYKLEFYFFIILGKLLGVFGFKNAKHSAKFFAIIFFYLIPIRKQVVIKNLSIAFPHLSKNEIKKLAFKNYINVAQTFLEIFHLEKFGKNELLSLFTEENLNDLKKITENKHGIIFLTGHVGNWELGALVGGLILESKVNVLIKNQKNPYVRDWMKSIREKFGNKQITLGTNVREIYSAIKKGEIVGIVGDQRGPRDAMKVNFFGRKTSVFSGTATIAVKTNCPVIFVFIVRKQNGQFDLILTEFKMDESLKTKEEKIFYFNQYFMEQLEEIIRKYPDQWLWMHNIWKY